jgi:DNA invertase Pin-like site-specific DNA recombinase
MRKLPGTKPGNGKAMIRCAIYTRKSSEEGLEQAFNSLDAQREACEAFIASQKHEGWIALPSLYDDGGISGGTLDRPALQRLLADIAAGTIDAVVVYKVDRLTRSLGDFAKIVEVFDGRGVSFVSVTQQFNTTTSMGRLTLNMLLSFAQFEREVTGERIRDKIAASKRKGMWMGGLPPLGYDAQDRKLVVNQSEAATVRHIFQRYTQLRSVRVLQQELTCARIVSKARTDRYGRACGGKPLARGALYLMLQNPIYRGEIVHKDQRYPGEHVAIVDAGLWATVQRILEANRVDREIGADAAEPSLLAGLLFDDAGERLTPTHANRKGRRYRYYVSQRLVTGGKPSAPDARRIPAGDLERLVIDRVREWLADEAAAFHAIEPLLVDVDRRRAVLDQAADLSHRWPKLAPSEKAVIRQLVQQIEVSRDLLKIEVQPARLLQGLAAAEALPPDHRSCRGDPSAVTLTIAVRLKRVGMTTKLLIEGEAKHPRTTPDRSLLRLLAQAHQFRASAARRRQIHHRAGGRGGRGRILLHPRPAPGLPRSGCGHGDPAGSAATGAQRQAAVAAHPRLPIGWTDQIAALGIR